MKDPHQMNWLTAPSLARQAHVSENTARRWMLEHRLGRKVGGRWRADYAAVARFLTGKDPAGEPLRSENLAS
jgi:hypothetical protein